MTQENEQSLAKRPEVNLAKLSKGGVIVGVEPDFRGSLIGVTGIGLERITRERLGENPAFKLPERSVSFLDPSTRRLIIISNREDLGRGKTPHKLGLFAEIVELDEEGTPRYRLSTNKLILPGEEYQLVAIGPNQFKLAPSHVEVEEESTEPEKKKFVPWNVRLAELQSWMDQVVVSQDERLENFLSRFREIRVDNAQKVSEKIKEAFPTGNQGFDFRVVPINLIITAHNQEELRQASIQAGLYPVIVSPDKMKEAVLLVRKKEFVADNPALSNILQPGGTTPAVVTIDERGVDYSKNDLIIPMWNINDFFVSEFPRHNPLFANVRLPSQESGEENIKEEHGFYYSYNKEGYLGLLNKLKADLLLTIFLRGGAPLTK